MGSSLSLGSTLRLPRSHTGCPQDSRRPATPGAESPGTGSLASGLNGVTPWRRQRPVPWDSRRTVGPSWRQENGPLEASGASPGPRELSGASLPLALGPLKAHYSLPLAWELDWSLHQPSAAMDQWLGPPSTWPHHDLWAPDPQQVLGSCQSGP